MLSRITVQGLFGEFDYDLILKDGPLTYIHAQNGNGKSTLMRLVYNLFQGNLEEVRTTPFQRLVLYFDNDSKLIVQNRNQELSVLMCQNRLEEELDQDDICNLQNTVYIGPERLYHVNDDGRIVPNDRRSTTKVNRSLFSGSRSKAKGPRGGRYGRHY